MNPGNYDIKVQRDATFSLSLTATDDLGEIGFDVTYTRAELLVWPIWAKEKGISGDPLFEMTTENARILLDGTSVRLQVSESDISALTFKEGVYELKMENTTADPTITDTLLEGNFTLEGLG